MKRYPVFLPAALTAVILATSACSVRHREDVRTVTYAVPGLNGSECSSELLRALAQTDGILDVAPDTTNRMVLVKYNSRVTAQKNIEHAIAAGGFDVADTPGDPAAKAKLPASCR